MRVMVFAIATEDSKMDMAPTPEVLEAFAAMDKFTEELAEAGILVAGAGLKPPAEGKRIVCEGPARTVIRKKNGETRTWDAYGGNRVIGEKERLYLSDELESRSPIYDAHCPAWMIVATIEQHERAFIYCRRVNRLTERDKYAEVFYRNGQIPT